MSKKISFLIVSAIFFSVAASLYVFNLQPFLGYDYMLMLGVVIAYIYINYKVYGKELSSDKILFFSYYILAAGLFLKFFSSLGWIPKITLLAMMSLLAYLIQLGLNVYIITERRSEAIPLIQPARTVVFIGLAITVFLSTTIVYKILWFESYPVVNSIIKSILFLGFFYTLFRSLGWFLSNEGVGVGTEKSASVIAVEYDTIWRLSRFAGVTLTQVAVVMMFTPVEDFSRGVFLASLMYVAINAIHAYLGHKVTWRLGVESLITAVFAYVLINFL